MDKSVSNFSEEEEKSLVGLLYNHISFGTTMEVFGELDKKGLSRLVNMRNIFRKLIFKYQLISQISNQDFLLIGLVDLIGDDELAIFSKSNNNHLKNRALYFLKNKK